MKIFFTLILLILITTSTHCQNKLVTGRLTDNAGSPMPGVNIVIKGTNVGTTSDVNGYYSISAPIGSTLVFAFVGMTTREVVVTGDIPAGARRKAKVPTDTQQPKVQPFPFLLSDSAANNSRGVAVLTPNTPSYNGAAPTNALYIRGIKRVGNRYYVKTNSQTTKRPIQLQFTSSFGIEQVTKLPKLQNQYAQGRPEGGSNQWRGAEQTEIFSWGPLLRTLEFTGEPYPYDKNGKLTIAGSGNGVPAKEYPALSFFKTGHTSINELKVSHVTRQHGSIDLLAEKRNRQGVTPNSNYDRINLQVTARKIRLSENLRLNSSLNYNNSTGRLLARGANLASLIGDVFRTPVSFDNSNGLTGKEAIKNSSSYLLADGSMRSHAPGQVDNPNALINLYPDKEKLERVLGSLGVDYFQKKFSIGLNSSIDEQWNNNTFGIPTGFSGYPDGRLTERRDNQTYINTVINPTYNDYINYSSLKFGLVYQNQITQRNLNRQDGFGFTPENYHSITNADSLTTRIKSLQRNVNELLFTGQWNYDEKFNVRLSNRAYFSNTLSKKSYNNFFPGAGLKLFLSNLIGTLGLDDLSVFSSWSKNIRESALLYNDWAYASSRQDISNYNAFYESTELFAPKGLGPETETKAEAGLSLLHRWLDLSLTYYNNLTKDFIAPQAKNSGYELSNVGTMQNTGFMANAGYRNQSYHGLNWGIAISWEKYNNKVTSINENAEVIALAGFNSVQTVLKAGKPFGAIYGTTYARNEAGQKIIGTDGYPLVDPQLRMIGNPIPDWKLGGNAFLAVNRFKMKLAFEYKKGGDLYNGTRAALDYLGRSAQTEKERTISNYTYEGVNLLGTINTTPVTFADPAQPVDANRWVRYGFGGVGEEYIEDASWFRLSDLSISYTLKPKHINAIKEVMIAVVSQNLLLITPYRGVDPASRLFGYSNGTGLDVFNQASTRSLSLQFTVKI